MELERANVGEDTVYIFKGKHNGNEYHGVGCASPCSAEETVHTVTCCNKEVFVDIVHHILSAHTIGCERGCFDVPFGLVLEVVNATQMFLDGMMQKLSERLDEAPGPAVGQPVSNTDRMPAVNDPEDYPKFMQDCFTIDVNGACRMVDIFARFRLWSRATSIRSSALAEYLNASNFPQRLIYDATDTSNATGYGGISMKPLPAVEKPDVQSDAYDFLVDKCAVIVSGRLATAELYAAYVAWKRGVTGGEYELVLSDKRALNALFNKEFLPSVVHTGARTQGGFYGVCLKGQEAVGQRKNSTNRKKVAVFDPATKAVIQVYESATHAAKELGVSAPSVSIAISGKKMCKVL